MKKAAVAAFGVSHGDSVAADLCLAQRLGVAGATAAAAMVRGLQRVELVADLRPLLRDRLEGRHLYFAGLVAVAGRLGGHNDIGGHLSSMKY